MPGKEGVMPLHSEPHPLAGKVVRIKPHVTHLQYPGFGGSEFEIEDWWDRVSGGSWMNATGNPACLIFAMRSAEQRPRIPTDDEVVYGKRGGMGSLLHVSEFEEIQ
jgi:hypothetical protein